MNLIRSVIGMAKHTGQDLSEQMLPPSVIELDEQELALATGGWKGHDKDHRKKKKHRDDDKDCRKKKHHDDDDDDCKKKYYC